MIDVYCVELLSTERYGIVGGHMLHSDAKNFSWNYLISTDYEKNVLNLLTVQKEIKKMFEKVFLKLCFRFLFCLRFLQVYFHLPNLTGPEFC